MLQKLSKVSLNMLHNFSCKSRKTKLFVAIILVIIVYMYISLQKINQTKYQHLTTFNKGENFKALSDNENIIQDLKDYILLPPNQHNSSPNERVVVYLAQKGRLPHLRASLYLLFKNFIDRFKYQIVIFHSGDMTWNLLMKSLIGILNKDQIKFLELHEVKDYWEFPPGYVKDFIPVWPDSYPNYHQMCAFWFRKIFLHPRMQTVSYYWRLDTDSFLLSHIDYDLFEFLFKNNITYGYRLRESTSCCANNMLALTQWFLLQNNLSGGIAESYKWIMRYSQSELLSFPNGIPPGNIFLSYYNNFEFVHVPSFRDHPIVWKFTETLWRDPLFNKFSTYRYNWGDATLRYNTIQIFPHLWNHVHHFCDIHYFHSFKQAMDCPYTDKPKDNYPFRIQESLQTYDNLCTEFEAKKFDLINCHKFQPK